MSFRSTQVAKQKAKRTGQDDPKKAARWRSALALARRKRAALRSRQEELHTPKLSDIMKRAEAGDALAAKEIAHILTLLVRNPATIRSPRPRLPDHREILPMPECARIYLSGALEQIAAGRDANKAFHLVREGKSRAWSHHDKVLVFDLMQQLIDQGKTVDDAALELCPEGDFEIAVHALAHKKAVGPRTPWKNFVGKSVGDSVIKKWYYEIKKERSA